MPFVIARETEKLFIEVAKDHPLAVIDMFFIKLCEFGLPRRVLGHELPELPSASE